MADPVLIDIPVGQWIKVATNVITGAVLPRISNTLYLQTIRDTGNAAPVDGDLSEGKELPYCGATIADVTPRDVYIAVKGSNPGQVRVDL
jgi:hypothetical protein